MGLRILASPMPTKARVSRVPLSTTPRLSPGLERTTERPPRRNGRAKGKRLEKGVAGRLSGWTGLPASEFTRARSGSKEPDVALSAAAAEAFPYHVECKNHAKLHLDKWIEQAVRDSPLVSHGREPIVVYTHQRKLWVATRFVWFCWLISQAPTTAETQAENSVIGGIASMPLAGWITVPFDLFMALAMEVHRGGLEGN